MLEILRIETPNYKAESRAICDWREARLAVRAGLLFGAFEVLVLEDIGRGAHQAKENASLTGFARWESIAREHDYLVRLAVGAVMSYLVNTGFAHHIAGLVDLTITRLP